MPSRYLDPEYRLTEDVDPRMHASPKGHRLIAAHLHNALLEARVVTGLDPVPSDERVVFPGQHFDRTDVEAEFKALEPLAARLALMPTYDGLMSREGMFSAPAASHARTVSVRLKLLDDPGLYPLSVTVRLESPENVSSTRVFDRFRPDVPPLELTKPTSLDGYPVVEVHVTADRVVAPRHLTPVSMHQPTVEVR